MSALSRVAQGNATGVDQIAGLAQRQVDAVAGMSEASVSLATLSTELDEIAARYRTRADGDAS